MTIEREFHFTYFRAWAELLVSVVLFTGSACSQDIVAGNRSVQPTISIQQLMVPAKAEKELEKAKAAFQKGEYAISKAYVEKALERYPGYAVALVLRGIMNKGEHKLDLARMDLERAINSDPGLGLSYVVLAGVHNDQANFQEADKTIKHALSLGEVSWRTYYEAARAAAGNHDVGSALFHIRKAQELGPSKIPEIHLMKAYILVLAGKPKQAIPVLKHVLSIDPSGPCSEKARSLLAELQVQK